MIKKIALICNPNKKENLEIVTNVKDFLSKKKIETCQYKSGIEDSELIHIAEGFDFAIVLGGDGTLLATSRALAPKGVPIFGINTGHLGFLTEGRTGNSLELIEKVLNNEFRIEEREMLSGCILNPDGNSIAAFIALNDVVINRGTSYKMIHMTLNVDDKPAADYIADGLIISTPTGSTAYAMSAGGAVMDPEIKGIEIVPICAHSLTNRPHIVADTRVLSVTFNRYHKGTIMQVDGQENYYIMTGEKVRITKAPYNVKLIRLLGEESDFYWTIRKKFHWGSLARQ